ncbi:MAG: hypothetical protein RL748_3243 [Pseudomonadota bacterium]|jgi:hypothetical protein
MNRRAIILSLGLLIAGYLAFFSEKPPSEVSEPVVRASAPKRTGNASSAKAGRDSATVTSKNFNPDAADAPAPRASGKADGKTKPAPEVLSLLPREALIAKAGNLADSKNDKGSDKGSAKADHKADSKTGFKADAKPAAGQAGAKMVAGDKAASKTDPKAPANKNGKPGLPAAIAGLMPADTMKPEALFDSQTWDPPPPPPPKPQPPPPPVAPPLPYQVIGKKLEDNAWEVYLTRGDSTFIAREKLVLEGQYRIESIKPPSMTLTYLPLNQTQTLNIGGND